MFWVCCWYYAKELMDMARSMDKIKMTIQERRHQKATQAQTLRYRQTHCTLDPVVLHHVAGSHAMSLEGINVHLLQTKPCVFVGQLAQLDQSSTILLT